MSGAACSYCGSTTATGPASVLSESQKISWGNRNLLDKVLIVLGSIWCIIILAVAIELKYWRPLELTAVLLAASPGIVFLLIGFRRKKAKATDKMQPRSEAGNNQTRKST